jgi:undecaprenyl-diphosphatase
LIEKLKSFDTELFLFLNGKHNSFFDTVMYWASDRLFWIPLYLFIAIILIKIYKKQSIFVFISIALLITITDQTASNLIKNTVQRLRPSHEPALQNTIYISKEGAGGMFGFVSSHAANSFALATFLFFILPNKYNPLKYILISWALLVSYSRIYNGVHYPSDVVVAAFIGIVFGYLVYKIYSINTTNI